MSRGAARVGRGGFTLVELLVVVVIAGLLAGLARPSLQRALLKARAAEAVSQLDVVDVAVRTYQADHHGWPPDRNRGIVPPGLSEYLPDGFTFTPGPFTIDYDNWSTQSPGFIGLTIITTDAELGQAMLELLGGGSTWTDGATKFTWVLEWS